MSIERTNRLKIALQKAKAGLANDEDVSEKNPSRLGRLLNKKGTLSHERRFMQSQPIHERPMMEAISQEILGMEVEYQPALKLENAHPVSRLKELRERSFDGTIPEGSLGDKIGFSSSGRPLWSTILDEQRNMPLNAPSQQLATPVRGERLHHSTILKSQADWPKRLQMSQRKTFKHWKVTAENKQATTI